jgi:predicted membrane protein
MRTHRKSNCSNHNSKGRNITGIVVIIIGVVFLADNFGYISETIANFLFNWKMLLIIIGIVQLTTERHKVSGVITLLIGAIFLLPEIFDFAFSFWKLIWPVVIILVGVALIFNGRSFISQSRPDTMNTENFDIFCFMGGADKRVYSQEFEGGKISAIMGGAKVNLGKADMKSDTVVLEIFSALGGVELIIPENWRVKFESVNILGGTDQSKVVELDPNTPKKTLIIKGVVILGGIEVKTY